METRTIDELTDAELGAMVRKGCYAKNVRFGDGQGHARFLLVMALPYGPDDFPEGEGPVTLAKAIEAFRTFVDDYDWKERNFQVYDHAAGQHFYEASYEGCEDEEKGGQR